MIRFKEALYRWIFTVMAFTSLFFLLGIIIVLLREGLPILMAVGPFKFLSGVHWYPTYDPAEFGIFPLIIASLSVAIGAMVVAVPLGVGSALYLHELAGERIRHILKPAVEILSAVPSIVFGFFGMMIVAPFVQKIFHVPTGLNAFTAAVVMGIMAIPTIASLTEDALGFVPRSFKEASYALGASRWQTLIKIVLPAAGSGVSTAIILGMSRIVGETMTVLMVSGGAAVIPHSIFDPVRPMTSTIAAEMGEAVTGSLHYSALFAIGLVLFLMTLTLNIISENISKKYRIKLGLDR
ncbi:MAG: phosphate ABC transporter permease subunit PstC [Elusimicrobia bacterium]|nr:phosphate ABC transporter permease subunit PstC [Elusimicrobiota bacterium]